MKKKKAHPLADAQATRLDILYGGTEQEVITETMKIATDSMRTLELEEHIFILNTLMNKRNFEALFMSTIDKRDSLRGASFFGAKLIQRLSFFEHLIPELKIRMVIINNFDLAVFNSRHRMQLLEFIKWLRDDMNIHIILCMNKVPATWGAQGSLRMMASSIQAIGEHEGTESQESIGVSSTAFDDAMRYVKAKPFMPEEESSERSPIGAMHEAKEPRADFCTQDELELAEHKVRECDVSSEYTPFSDPQKYGHSSSRSLVNKELRR